MHAKRNCCETWSSEKDRNTFERTRTIKLRKAVKVSNRCSLQSSFTLQLSASMTHDAGGIGDENGRPSTAFLLFIKPHQHAQGSPMLHYARHTASNFWTLIICSKYFKYVF